MLEPVDGMDVFTDLIPLSDNGVIVGGRFGKDQKDTLSHPLLIRYDERLKKSWEVRSVGPQSKTIEHVLEVKDRWVVSGNVQDQARSNGVYVGVFNKDGKVIAEYPTFESGHSLSVRAMIPSQDGAGFLMAVQAKNTADDTRQFGQILKISHDGKILWKRAFKPGASSVYTNITPTLDGQYLITGQLVMDDSKASGVLIRVDENGAIVWQKTYPRGSSASLSGAFVMNDGSILSYGRIRPLSGSQEGLSAWIMKTDSLGAVQWQRYLTSEDYDYEARDAIVYEDGRASILINGAPKTGGYRGHARIATVSSTGQLLFMEEFTDGQNAQGLRLVPGLNGERIIVGFAQTSFGENQQGNDPAPPYTYDGWFVAAPALETYTDPCAPPPPQNPLLP